MRAAVYSLGVLVVVSAIAAMTSAAAEVSGHAPAGQTHSSAIVDAYYYHGRHYPYYHNHRYYGHRYWSGGRWRYY
jgi:hypothetical protein